MNDSNNENPRLITRRTVAKTAAWAAPAIALAAASPAYAASTGEAAMIVFDAPSYEVPEGGTLTITGMLIPATGGTVPAGIKLDASMSGGSGFNVLSPPVVTGNTFTMTVKAGAGASATTLKVSSWNYGVYTPGTAALTVGAPAGVILVGQPSYNVPQGGVLSVKGTLQAPQGGTLPADIQLVASSTDGFDVLIQPVVTGNTFELVVSATSAPGATGTLTVSSSNYPAYTPGTAALTAAAGNVSTGGPAIEWDEQVFTAQAGASTTITGKIILPPGMTELPSDFTLVAQSAVSGWKVSGTPVMTGPDTFAVTLSAPVERGMTLMLVFSPTHPEFGAATAYVKNFA
ncbi:hypothetical protein ACFQ9V_00570 [Leifsonia sp. NPDC056665]|uniref:hypothetical protein n=1 Tax=Leifsonia sp. NPDC056665 TaxID=3345901 RepID=UPI00368BFCCF